MASRRRPLAALAVFTLAACSAAQQKPPEVDPLLPPADYRKQILAMMPKLVDEVTGIREVGITELAITPVGSVSLYTACVRYNPRTSPTGYLGVRERFAIFHGGQLGQFVPASSGQCAKAVYQPFPELERLCVGASCPRS
jgi:hypothetical protein